ncbi:tyrosine-type recombinase/integrase [Streptomyces sp. NPDC058548]|uniref:tyrosine-type recombinase/integrase n=1 Tax=Streptomyces sp. NPDC058548 TaxID=3346545 RepID=UPI003655B42D
MAWRRALRESEREAGSLRWGGQSEGGDGVRHHQRQSSGSHGHRSERRGAPAPAHPGGVQRGPLAGVDSVVPRQNDNRARAKAGRSRAIPASAELMRLYSDYLHREYGALNSDYVFVNLFAEPQGHPWGYPAVYDLVQRLRRTTGIFFEPHQYRHTYATWLLRRGAGMEKVKELLGHVSISTTIDTYGHLTVEDARRALEETGWFVGREVRL